MKRGTQDGLPHNSNRASIASSDAGLPVLASSLPQAFARVARLHAARPALVDGERSWTYAALERAVQAQAAALARLGVVRGDCVGLHAPRCAEAVIGMLAIVTLGATYVPFDPAAPEQRLARQADTAGVRVLVVAPDPALSPWAAQRAVHVIDADAVDASAPDARVAAPSLDLHGLELAYVMYTSGSTNEPKGVCITHRAVIELALGASYAGLHPDDVVCHSMSIAFDGATFEVWGALLNGACLAIAPPRASVKELCDLVERRGVTVMLFSTGLFNSLTADALRRLARVRVLLAGGDVMSPLTASGFLQAGGRRLVNGYGPTEITTFSHCHVMDAAPDATRAIPIGGPIPGTSSYVLDADLRPVPVGGEGELYVGGSGLAQGYLGHRTLTAERFLPDPFAADGSRMYRTGDLVRQAADGGLEYIGRIDTQVKIRGFRVELAEVETCLGASGHVRAACVIHLREPHPHLVAFCVARTAHATTEQALMQQLRQRLPEYMLPRQIVFLPELPLTINGKVDRVPLEAIARQRSGGQACEPPAAAGDALEQQLIAQLRSLLNDPRIGPEDNFFDVGGDSLVAMRLCAHLSEAHAVDLPLSALFQAPSLGALIEQVRQLQRRASPPSSALLTAS